VSGSLSPEERDRIVLRLHEQLLEVEQRLIPIGMHVFGCPPDDNQQAEMLRMVASFDRPEAGIRSLPDLVAYGLGLPDYRTLLEKGVLSEEWLERRERVDAIVREAIAIPCAEHAVEYLAREASVPAEESRKVFALLNRIREQLAVNPELDAFVRALRGDYIEPGPGADIIQNPAILPTGRNTHAVNPYGIPSSLAFLRSEEVVTALLNRFLEEKGHYPEAIGMVLWGMDNIKTHGEGVAQALWLMGVKPRRDGMNRVADVDVIPLDLLRRPRIDVVMTVSGIFRDLFGSTLELLDKAVLAIAALDEPFHMNFVRKHVKAQVAEGASPDDAAIRVFSNAAGNYGTNVNFMVMESQWEQTGEIADLFMKRKCFAYRRGLEGREARELMERALSRVEATYQNIDNAEIGITDVDHYFEYLGGLSRAVEQRSGEMPKIYLSDALTPLRKIRSLEETIRLETRTKTLNPKWFEGMLKHGFSGVAEIEHHVTNTFGWSASADAVDQWVYDEIAKTYLLDEAMLERLRSLNPHSTRGLASRMIEAEARGFWTAGEAVIEQLRAICTGIEDQIEGLDRMSPQRSSAPQEGAGTGGG